MPRRWIALVVVSLCACGATTAPGAEPEHDRESSSEGASGTSEGTSGASGTGAGGTGSGDTASSRCPPRYGQAPPSCEAGDDPGRCVYPEGVCECRVPTWCGGAAPPPRPTQWICEAPRPVCGADGTPCDREGASCALGPCGWDTVVCQQGVWRGHIGQRPP